VLAAIATDNAALNIAADIEKNVNEGVGIIKKLAEDNSKLTDKYNMPKYPPPQSINLQVTNCNVSPALCVH